MKEAHQAEAALLRTLYSMRVQPLLVFEEAAQWSGELTATIPLRWSAW